MGIRWAILGILITVQVYAQIPAQTMPDFTFHRLDGGAFSNRELPSGKKTFFVFFDPDCNHCQRAVKNIDQQYRGFQNTLVCLVSAEDRDKMSHFMNTYAPHLKGQKQVLLLQDERSRFITLFKPYKYPAMFLYAPDRRLLDYEDNEETVFRIIHTIQNKGG